MYMHVVKVLIYFFNGQAFLHDTLAPEIGVSLPIFDLTNKVTSY